MTPAEISHAKGGDVLSFTYANCDVADTQEFRDGNWGLYSADTVSVGHAITPDVDSDGVTSLPGKVTFSVTLYHLDTFSSSHVEWVGDGVIVEYTLDGATWAPLSQDGVVALDGDSDFDIRVTFAGGVEDDTANLSLLRVIVLKTDTISTAKRERTLTFSADPIVNGTLTIDQPVTVSAGETAIQTIELWATFSADSVLPQGTVYTNGDKGSPAFDGPQHVVIVLAQPSTDAFTLGPNMVISHLALYQNAFTADQVATLYTAQSGLAFRIDDINGLSVTENSPAVDTYAYAWSVIPGSHA